MKAKKPTHIMLNKGPWPYDEEKERAIIEMREAGMTQKQIGDQLGLTKQRVGQILKRARLNDKM